MTRPAKAASPTRAIPGTTFALHVTRPPCPPHGIDRVHRWHDQSVCDRPPEDGEANAAVAELVAHAFGVAKSSLSLTLCATSPGKVFRLD